MSTDLDWNKMRTLVLQRLHAKYDGMSDYMRNLPTLHFQDSESLEEILVSPTDALREVEHLSELGKKIIVAQLKLVGELQP